MSFTTCLKRVPDGRMGQCYVCGAGGIIHIWDPESNGLICDECSIPYQVAERRLIETKGICRPPLPTTKKGRNAKNTP